MNNLVISEIFGKKNTNLPLGFHVETTLHHATMQAKFYCSSEKLSC